MCLCLYQLSYWLCRRDLFPVSENQKVQLLSQWYECGKRCTLMIEILCLCFLVHTKLNQFSCQLAVSLIFPCCCWNRSDVWEPCNRLWAGCVQKHLMWDFAVFNMQHTLSFIPQWGGGGRCDARAPSEHCRGTLEQCSLLQLLVQGFTLPLIQMCRWAPAPSLHGKSGSKEKWYTV